MLWISSFIILTWSICPVFWKFWIIDCLVLSPLTTKSGVSSMNYSTTIFKMIIQCSTITTKIKNWVLSQPVEKFHSCTSSLPSVTNILEYILLVKKMIEELMIMENYESCERQLSQLPMPLLTSGLNLLVYLKLATYEWICKLFDINDISPASGKTSENKTIYPNWIINSI